MTRCLYIIQCNFLPFIMKDIVTEHADFIMGTAFSCLSDDTVCRRRINLLFQIGAFLFLPIGPQCFVEYRPEHSRGSSYAARIETFLTFSEFLLNSGRNAFRENQSVSYFWME